MRVPIRRRLSKLEVFMGHLDETVDTAGFRLAELDNRARPDGSQLTVSARSGSEFRQDEFVT